MFRSVALTFLTSALLARAASFTVLVGADNALAFTPSSINNVQAGDVVDFQFQSKNHSVTQSTFAAPCTPMTTPNPGIDSGFQFVQPGSTQVPQFSITIQNASAPLWFFCAQTNPASHCGSGMVFAINPTAEKSFDAFQTAAKDTAGGAGAPAGGSSAPSPSASTPAGAGAGGASPAGTGAGGASPAGTGAGGASPAGAGAGGASPNGASPVGASGVTSVPPATNTNGGMSVRGGAAGVLLAVALGAMLL